jgi:hypothetical protein
VTDDGWTRAQRVGSVVMMVIGAAAGLIKLGITIGVMQVQPQLDAAQARVRHYEDALRRAIRERRR